MGNEKFQYQCLASMCAHEHKKTEIHTCKCPHTHIKHTQKRNTHIHTHNTQIHIYSIPHKYIHTCIQHTQTNTHTQ